MNLNFRKPVFIIPGAWNQAILQRPEWLARWVYGYAEGNRVETLQVYEDNPVTHLARLIQYIEDIGILVEPGRLSLFVNVTDNIEHIFESLEEKVINIVNTLQHTPISGYGVNFSFEIQSPSDTLLGVFDTTDNIKKKGYNVKGEKITVSMKFEEGVILNLGKENIEGRVMLDFNYHHEKFDLEKFKEKGRGSIFRFYNQTLDILKNCYEADTEDITILRHSFKEVPNAVKEDKN